MPRVSPRGRSPRGKSSASSAPAWVRQRPSAAPLTPRTGRIPPALGGVSVLLDEDPVPLLYVQESQINAQVPYELAGRSSAQLAVAYGGVGGPRAALAVSPARPALFLIPGSMSAPRPQRERPLERRSAAGAAGGDGDAVRQRTGRDVARPGHRSTGLGNGRAADRRRVGHDRRQRRGSGFRRLGAGVLSGSFRSRFASPTPPQAESGLPSRSLSAARPPPRARSCPSPLRSKA